MAGDANTDVQPDLTSDPDTAVDMGEDPTPDTGEDVAADLTDDAVVDLADDAVADLADDVVVDLADDAVADLADDSTSSDAADAGADIPSDVAADTTADDSADVGLDIGVDVDGGGTGAIGVMITEIMDGDLTGGLPKFVEITNCGDEAIDLSDYSLGNYNNGGSSLGGGSSTVLSGSLEVGESFVVGYEDDPGDAMSFFEQVYGLEPDIFVGPFINGDDVVALFLADGSGTDGAATGDGTDATLVDVYGVIGVNGDGEDWDYTDSFAARRPDVDPAAGAFDAAEWSLPGVSALDTLDGPEHAVRTSPGHHMCFEEVHGSGTFTVAVAWGGDLDGGAQIDASDAHRDFNWEDPFAGEAELAPAQGAIYAVIESEPDYGDCVAAPLSDAPISGADGGDIAVGNWLCARTGDGRISALQVTALDESSNDITVDYTTWATHATYPVAATITGLTGQGLFLRYNGEGEVAVEEDGRVVLDTEVAAGSDYEVTVLQQPMCPSEIVSVSEDSAAGAAGVVGAFVDVVLTVDAPRERLFAFNYGGGTRSVYITDDIGSLTDGATGTPRLLEGDQTALDGSNSSGIAVDSVRDRLYLAKWDGTRIFEDASTVQGNVAPSVTLTAGGGWPELDERRDRLYLGMSFGPLRIFNDASELTGSESADVTLGPFTEVNPEILDMDLDRLNDRLYVTSGNAITILDDASTLTSDSTPSATLTWTIDVTGPPRISQIAVDPCTDRLYVASNRTSPNGNYLVVFADASTLNGAIDFDDDSVATLTLESLVTAVENDRLYTAADSGTVLRIWDNASTLAGEISTTPDRTLSGVINKATAVDVVLY